MLYEKKSRPEPTVGDKRTKTGFALLPKKTSEGFVWLSRYFVEEVYEIRGGSLEGMGYVEYWLVFS